jgi:hypothetical protein
MNVETVKLVPLDVTRRYLRRRGFDLSPKLEETHLGRSVRLGLRSRGERGYWWLSHGRKAIYRFEPTVLFEAASRIIDWIAPFRALIVSDYVTDWRRIIADGFEGETQYGGIVAALTAGSVGSPTSRSRRDQSRMLARAAASLSGFLRLRGPVFCGGLLLEGWAAEEMARFAGTFPWKGLTDAKAQSAYDVYLFAPGRRQVLRLQQTGSLWCYGDEGDLETFASICSCARFDGVEVSEKSVSMERIVARDGRPLAWVKFRGGTFSKPFQDIPLANPDAAEREDSVGAYISMRPMGTSLEMRIERQEGDARAVVILVGRDGARDLRKALRRAAAALESAGPFERIVINADSAESGPDAEIVAWVAEERVYFSMRTLTKRARLWFTRDEATLFADTLAKVCRGME